MNEPKYGERAPLGRVSLGKIENDPFHVTMEEVHEHAAKAEIMETIAITRLARAKAALVSVITLLLLLGGTISLILGTTHVIMRLFG